jgi:predicted nucleic acid-binding protein
VIVVADTGAVLALLDRNDRHHAALKRLFLRQPQAWVLPAAILPEVDYLVATHLGARAQGAFLSDAAAGRYQVEWHDDDDLQRAADLHEEYRDLRLGVVDTLVMAAAERLDAGAIATLDLRHFGAVTLVTAPRLVPRDTI